LRQDCNVLIVKLSALGDVVHALVASTVIKRRLPCARIFWLTREEYFPLFEHVDFVDELFPYSLKGLLSLRNIRFDVVFDLQGLLKSSWFLPLLKAPRRAGFSLPEVREKGAVLFYNYRVTPSKPHVIEKLRQLVCGGLEIEDDGLYPSPFRVDEGFCRKPAEPYGVLLPSAAWETKVLDERWVAEFIRKMREVGVRVLVLVGKGDYLRLRGVPYREDFLVGLGLKEAFSVIYNADFVVGPDTGFLHIASALKKRVFALYCPTAPERNGPFNTECAVFTCECPERGCFRRRCVKNCTSSIPVDSVVEAFYSLA